MADRKPERLRFDVGGRKVSGVWSAAPAARAVAIVAHGAGAGMEHPFMEGAAAGLVADGVTAFRFNFPYTEEGRRAPDRPGLLREAWIAAFDEGTGFRSVWLRAQATVWRMASRSGVASSPNAAA